MRMVGRLFCFVSVSDIQNMFFKTYKVRKMTQSRTQNNIIQPKTGPFIKIYTSHVKYKIMAKEI